MASKTRGFREACGSAKARWHRASRAGGQRLERGERLRVDVRGLEAALRQAGLEGGLELTAGRALIVFGCAGDAFEGGTDSGSEGRQLAELQLERWLGLVGSPETGPTGFANSVVRLKAGPL